MRALAHKWQGRRRALVVGSACLAASAGALAVAASASAVRVTTTRGSVVRVIDGDSVRVRVSGRLRTFNLLGVNAPDGRQCFTAQAKRALSTRLPFGARVTLVNDSRRAGPGRYVYRGTNFINAAILRAGAARSVSLGGLSRAGTLRNSTRSAQNADRGLFGRCVGSSPKPTPTPDPPPSPVDVAKGVRDALTGKQLVDFTSSPNSSTKNTTRFCDGGRSDRVEDFSGSTSFRNELTGTWAVFAAIREADGKLVAEISFLPDDQSFAQKIIRVSVASDGTVRREDANASELQTGGPCSPSQAPAGFENDTQAARNKVLQALTGKRLDEGNAGAVNDFCSAQRATRREGGNVVVDGPWSVEWAASSSTGTVGALALKDSDSSASRRILVAIPPSGPPQVRNLGVGDDTGHAATLAGVSC